MSVHPKLGPYVTMAGKMIQNMSYIIVMLVVTLLSFGLARQSITYPDETWHWILVRNIFLKPYFMLYGEVYADEIDTCGDEGSFFSSFNFFSAFLSKNISSSIILLFQHGTNILKMEVLLFLEMEQLVYRVYLDTGFLHFL